MRLWLGYAGTKFADEEAFALRHGLSAGAGWLGLAPWYGALSAELTPPLENRDTVAFQVVRVPMHAHLGHRYRQGPVLFDLELALTVELLHRTADRNQAVPSSEA